MGPEMWVALAAVFVSGGAVGTAGTLLTQWLLRRFDDAPSGRNGSSGTELDGFRYELGEMGRELRNLDARLDFTERLLDGALAPAPARMSESGLDGAEPRRAEPRPEV